MKFGRYVAGWLLVLSTSCCSAGCVDAVREGVVSGVNTAIASLVASALSSLADAATGGC